MTTTTPRPLFAGRTSRPALRAAAILGLWAALAGGFVAHAWQPGRAAQAAADAVAAAPAPGAPV
jgi:hypothetical protein